MSIAETGEFGLIARIVARLEAGPATLLGPGDDGAVVAAPDGRIVASTDVLVEGRHFRRDWSGAADIGHRAAAANLADIAAMGAAADRAAWSPCAYRPTSTSTGPRSWPAGSARKPPWSARAWSAGDMSSSPTLTVAVTALGDLQGQEPVLRSGDPAGRRHRDGRAHRLRGGRVTRCCPAGFRTPKMLVEAYRRPEVPYQPGSPPRPGTAPPR